MKKTWQEAAKFKVTSPTSSLNLLPYLLHPPEWAQNFRKLIVILNSFLMNWNKIIIILQLSFFALNFNKIEIKYFCNHPRT